MNTNLIRPQLAGIADPRSKTGDNLSGFTTREPDIGIGPEELSGYVNGHGSCGR